MKKLFILMALLFCVSATAQYKLVKKRTFVRIFNEEGKKINKGLAYAFSDSLIVLKRGKDVLKIPFNEIHLIKTKRSTGHDFLVPSVMLSSIFALAGVASADPDAWIFGYSKAEGAAYGVIFGTFVGSVVGGIASLVKNSKSYEINGEIEKFHAFRQLTINN